jgi:hypothetical protein
MISAIRLRLGALLVRLGARLIGPEESDEELETELAPPPAVTVRLTDKARAMVADGANPPRAPRPDPPPPPLIGSLADRAARARAGNNG